MDTDQFAQRSSPARQPARVRMAAIVLFVACLTAACGGGGGGGGASAPAPVSGGAPSSSASSASSASSGQSSAATSSASSASSRVSLYLAEPVIANCDKGILKESERVALVDKLNAVRARHGLPAVAYDTSENDAAGQAALYMVANRTLTNAPQPSGLCYTAAAAQLAAQSNIYVTVALAAGTTQDVASTRPVVSYLLNATSPSLSERRRLLNPFLSKVSVGRVDGTPPGGTQEYMSTVVKVIGNDVPVATLNNDFVAYPYGSYPASEFATDGYLSFSSVANKADINANGSSNISYANATVTVSNGGVDLTVTDKSFNYLAYGVPNSLQWRVTGLQTGVTYTVRIGNVQVNGAARDFTYSFTLTQ